MTVGERIRERRKELHLSQSELAERMGYKSKVAISNVENNKEDLTTNRVRKYAEALQTTPSYLMGWDKPYDPDNELFNSDNFPYFENILLSKKCTISDYNFGTNKSVPGTDQRINLYGKYLSNKIWISRFTGNCLEDIDKVLTLEEVKYLCNQSPDNIMSYILDQNSDLDKLKNSQNFYLSDQEQEIIKAFRKADTFDKTTVLRTLGLGDKPANNEEDKRERA